MRALMRYLAVATAAVFASGCIQTLPDGSVVATPNAAMTTGSLLTQESGPASQHVVNRDRDGRLAADPDAHIRISLRRDQCQIISPEGPCAD
jgi:hypothetical protein